MEDFFETWNGRQAWIRSGTLPIEKKTYSGMVRRPVTPPDLQQQSPPPFSQQHFPRLSKEGGTEPAVSSINRREAREIQDKASPNLTLSPHLGSSPSPHSWSCHLAWKLESLKENSPHDKTLQKLKERIRQQRQRSLSWPLREKRLAVCSMEGSPAKQPLKRKIRKVVCASPALVDTNSGVHPDSSTGGRAGKKKRSHINTAPLPEKTQKKKAVHLYGVSAWREGQKLARKILGPPPKHPKLRSGLEMDAAELATESGNLLTTSQVEQSLRGSFQAMQSDMGEAEQEREASGLNRTLRERASSCGPKNQSVRLQKDPYLQKRGGNQPRLTGKKENASPQGHSANPFSARLEDNRGTSTDCKGRTSYSSQRSDSSRKESKSADSYERPDRERRSHYSPEEVREFMNKKVAERNRRSREEKRSLEQAREVRKKRLQEVYQKQKEAFRSKKNGMEAGSAMYAKNIHGLKEARDEHPEFEVMERVHQASCALLRDEVKLRRDKLPRKMTLYSGLCYAPGTLEEIVVCDLRATMDKMENVKVDSLEIGSVFISPLKLRDLDGPSFPSARYSGSPFLSKKPGWGLEASAVLNASGLSPYRNKEDRVRAIHILARDLSQRLEREIEKLQVRNRMVDLKDPRWLSGTPVLSEMPQKMAFGPTGNTSATCGSTHSLHLSTKAQESGERTFLEDGSRVHLAKKSLHPFFLTPSAGHDMLKWPSSPEENQSTVETEGCALEEGFQKLRNFLPEDPRAVLSTPSLPLYSGRIPLGSSTGSQAEIQSAPHENMGEKEDSTQKHPGLQPGHCGNTLPPCQACSLSSPSASFPHNKTLTADEETSDRSEPADSTSQWSKMSQFYGGSSTFHRFGLKMVEQYLREEELRARHQSALLRLREKALQEKARAELAWLEHEKSCQDSLQDSDGSSATAQKQLALLTRLKQEQAEIRHLQNICRAAHQERKLLLKQQKDLLLVQETTAQLWKQLHEQLEKSLRPVHGTQKGDAKASLDVLSDATALKCSRDRSSTSPQQGVGTKNLHVESGEMSLQGMEESEEFTEQKQHAQDAENEDIIRGKDFHFCREQPVGTEDYLVRKEKEEQDTGLIKKMSKEDPLGSSKNEPQCLASTTSLDKLYHFSPNLEDPPFDSEFHKAHAILINISQSSLSSFEEAEDAQDTDISLPEEFISQEQLHDDSYGGVLHDTPAIPLIAIHTPSSSGRRSCTQMSGSHSNQDDLSATCRQEKSLEGLPASERGDVSDSMKLSNEGRPRPDSAWMGGSHYGQANTITIGRDATSLKNSEPRTWAECVDKMAFQGDAESDAIVSQSRTSFYSRKDQKEQGPTEASSTVEGDCNSENPSHSKDESMMLVHKASLKAVDSISEDSALLKNGEVQSFSFASHNSSNPLLVSGSRSGCVERSVGEVQSSLLDETTTIQLPKASMSDDDIGVGSLHPQTTEGTAKVNQNISTMNSQNTKEPGMATLHASSPKAGKLFSLESCFQRTEDDALPPSNEHLPGIEDEILSPVDEVLSYGSTDLPPATEKDISFQSEGLPAPPEDLSEKGGDSNFSLLGFPSPPEQLVFPETGELQYATDEDASIKTNELPSLSDDVGSEHYL